MKFVIASVLVGTALAGFIPPYYGGSFDRHGDHYGRNDQVYGERGLARGGYDRGYHGDEYDRAAGDRGYYGGDYGSHSAADGRAGYEDGGAQASGDAEHKAGSRHAADAEGTKKFSYFSSGSGPEGSYSRGYYGSEGYDHENSKSKYASDASGAGYKKGFGSQNAAHADSAASYDKSASTHEDFDKKHDSGKYGYEKAGYDRAGHSDGWVNGDKHSAYGEHGPHY